MFIILYKRQWPKSFQRKTNAKRQNGSEEATKITEERREVKGKGERERYTQMNVEFQRIARRDKKDS